jgi:hypothetical protein
MSQPMKQVFRPFGFRSCLGCGRNAAAYSEDSPSAPGASLGGLRRSFARSFVASRIPPVEQLRPGGSVTSTIAGYVADEGIPQPSPVGQRRSWAILGGRPFSDRRAEAPSSDERASIAVGSRLLDRMASFTRGRSAASSPQRPSSPDRRRAPACRTNHH